MKILNNKPESDLSRIKKLSLDIGKKISQTNPEAKKIDDFSFDELQDLNKILQMADFILCKNEERKKVYSMMKEFVEMIKDSADSVSSLDDEISEMVLSAEEALKRIKGIQCKVSEDYAFESKSKSHSKDNLPQNGSINLTKSSTPIYTQEYQPNSTLEAEQVI